MGFLHSWGQIDAQEMLLVAALKILIFNLLKWKIEKLSFPLSFQVWPKNSIIVFINLVTFNNHFQENLINTFTFS